MCRLSKSPAKETESIVGIYCHLKFKAHSEKPVVSHSSEELFWSDYEKPGIDRLIKYNKKHIVLTEAETKAFEDKLKPVTERWIKEVEAEGIDGRKLVNKARKLIKKYEE